jgi:hypothetical protein
MVSQGVGVAAPRPSRVASGGSLPIGSISARHRPAADVESRVPVAPQASLTLAARVGRVFGPVWAYNAGVIGRVPRVMLESTPNYAPDGYAMAIGGAIAPDASNEPGHRPRRRFVPVPRVPTTTFGLRHDPSSRYTGPDAAQ